MKRTVFAVLVAAVAMMSSAVVRGAELAPGEVAMLVTDGLGVPVSGATVAAPADTATTDHWGRAAITVAAGDTIEVDHARYRPRSVVWSGEAGRLVVHLGDELVRAVHVSGTLPGTARWNELLALADATSVNGFMLDVKDESGFVYPRTDVALAHEVGAALQRWNLADVVTELHGHGLAVVARIVSFQDPIAGQARPDIAVQTATGDAFTRRGQTFLDPTDPVARGYALDLAQEVCAAGADEVQFDYVRYPDGDRTNLHFDGGKDEPTRVETIRSFLAEAEARVPSTCRVAADIFGFTTSVPGDGGIGHHLETLATVTDVLSPMAYPNHWGRGWFGYDEPADHPGGVIDASMRDAIARVGGSVTIRPWLQDFGGYGAAEVRAQIEAADELGLGWMLWNSASRYTDAGIPLEHELRPATTVVPFVETLPVSGFWDVPDTSTFALDVRWLGAEGITTGCNPPWRDDFCPFRPLTRAEAATMLVRALDLPAATTDRFGDDDGTTHEAAINALAAAGITRGCSATAYCPEQPLTRAQMASLLARALDLADAAGDTFSDDDQSSHEADIERIAAVGITRGCSATHYCPDEPVRRDQIAAFLHRALR